jgi:hypothetical protein
MPKPFYRLPVNVVAAHAMKVIERDWRRGSTHSILHTFGSRWSQVHISPRPLYALERFSVPN